MPNRKPYVIHHNGNKWQVKRACKQWGCFHAGQLGDFFR